MRSGPVRSGYAPPAWLRNPHLQSLLASSPLRAVQSRRRLRQVPATHAPTLLELTGGVRLRASPVCRRRARRGQRYCCCTAGRAAPNPATCG